MLEDYLHRIKFSMFSDKENLPDIRKFLNRKFHEYGIHDTICEKIILAIDEGCANAIIHGNNSDINTYFDVEIRISKSSIWIDISDNGSLPTTTDTHVNRQIDDLISERKNGGMGLKLIHTLMDEVNFLQIGDKKVCRLMKAI